LVSFHFSPGTDDTGKARDVNGEKEAFLFFFVDANRVKTVLEFGPGASTAVFLNKGLLVHSCENDERWLAAARAKFSNATFFHYENVDKIKIDGLLDQYNLCFVDGPKGKPSWSRLNSLLFCAAKSRLILLHDSSRGGEGRSKALKS
jgi:predicted O-methyltransferase YrrM